MYLPQRDKLKTSVQSASKVAVPVILEATIFEGPAHFMAKYAFPWINYNKKLLIDRALKTNMKVSMLLDVGGGGYSELLLRKFPNCQSLLIVNFSREAMRHVKQELTTHVDFVLADAHRLPFRKVTFSLAFMKDLLHHVKNPVKILKEVKKVTKDEVVIVETNRPNSIMLFWDKYGVHHHFTLSQLLTLPRKADMKLRDHKQLAAYPLSLLFWPIKKPPMALWNVFLILFLFSTYLIPHLPEVALSILSSFLKPSFNVIYASG